MRLPAIAAALLLSTTALADERPCTQQNYADAKQEPRYDCPGPGEAALVPDVPLKPSMGLTRGTTVKRPGKPAITLKDERLLMGKQRVISLGMRIKALRRLRWLDLHKGAAVLEVERQYLSKVAAARQALRDSQLKSYKQQLAEAREQRDRARAWYRSWTFGLVVGVVLTSAATVAIAVAAK